MNECYMLVLKDKQELLTPIRQEFYLIDDVRSDYLEYLLKKAAIVLQDNFGIAYSGLAGQKVIIQDLVRHFYKGGNEKDCPIYLKRMINQAKLKTDKANEKKD